MAGQTVVEPNRTESTESRDTERGTLLEFWHVLLGSPSTRVVSAATRAMSALSSWRSCGHAAASTNLWPATPLESEQTKMTSVLRASCSSRGSAGRGARTGAGTHVVQFMEISGKLRSSHSLLGQGRFWWTKRFLYPCIIIRVTSGGCLVPASRGWTHS